MSRDRVSVDLCKAINGLEKVVLRDVRGSSAEVYWYGGQVTSWKNHGPCSSLRRPYTVGFQYAFLNFQVMELLILEQHGFARNKIWRIDTDSPHFPTNSSNKTFVDLILGPSEDDMKIWPHSEVRVEGLETVDYVNYLQNRERFTEQGDALTFESEVDKIYVSTPPKIAILDHEKKRTFVLRKDGLPDPVVWSPWDRKAKAMPDFGDDEYMHMLCVENAATEKPITLKPGEEWRGRLELCAVQSSYCSGRLDPRKVLHG